jgi:hypothetical protein
MKDFGGVIAFCLMVLGGPFVKETMELMWWIMRKESTSIVAMLIFQWKATGLYNAM